MHHPYLHAFRTRTMRPCPPTWCLADTTPLSLWPARRIRDAAEPLSFPNSGLRRSLAPVLRSLYAGATVPTFPNLHPGCYEMGPKRSNHARRRSPQRSTHDVGTRRTPRRGFPPSSDARRPRWGPPHLWRVRRSVRTGGGRTPGSRRRTWRVRLMAAPDPHRHRRPFHRALPARGGPESDNSPLPAA